MRNVAHDIARRSLAECAAISVKSEACVAEFANLHAESRSMVQQRRTAVFVRGQEIATLRGQLASTAQAPERLRGLARAGVPGSNYVSWAQRGRQLQMKEYQLWKALSEQLKRYRADVKKTLGQMSVEWAKHTAKLVAGKARVTCLLALATIDMSVLCSVQRIRRKSG